MNSQEVGLPAKIVSPSGLRRDTAVAADPAGVDVLLAGFFFLLLVSLGWCGRPGGERGVGKHGADRTL
ncbi:hypothetical protein KPA07_09710 [Corynebacterium aurimucosum]|uniref:hypothetical protein n=1 Tax=Corynebacterium aurimucosum TaxID=169292 RepID=UPI001C0EBD9D|nr:hypothetical protein [Corynebacterium aurimucosum]MBU5655178.1 hypothetical protein [Corynebacterium aurimucosum]